MPVQPNQQPAPGQAQPLSTDRVESTIPQADGQSRWVYPSPQMFYNALRRKNKTTGEEEDHMDAVVAIHNNMNERTWRKILEWEKRYCDECPNPTLARFMGRPDELSVEAQLRLWTRGDRPFDRHDWFVNRCGREVRYVIDYYDVPDKHPEDKVPTLHDEKSVQSIELVVRPALDSFEAAVDRAKTALEETSLAAALPRPSALLGVGEASPPKPSNRAMAELRDACAPHFDAVSKCVGDDACSQAHFGLVMCMAAKVCKAEATVFEKALAKGGEGAGDREFADIQACLGRYAAKAREAEAGS